MDSVGPLPYTRARIVNNFVLSSGHVPLNAEGQLVSPDFASQFEYVVRGIETSLGEVGATLKDVVQLRCYLARQEDFDELNALCRQAFPEPFPTRTTVVVDMARPGILIEIEPTAVIGEP